MPFSTRYILLFASALILLLFSFAYSLIAWSSFPLNLSHISAYFFNFDHQSIEQQILATTRIPRLLVAILIGTNLAVAGVLMQGLTRNPLASPSILGINAGAACFMALASIGINVLGEVSSLVSASVGGLVSGALVIFLGGFFQPVVTP
ncbi:iron chelate uptake ABC transporter family permease subunit [Psychromonas sp. KJ10-2]|uniref:iron chelate uptake ABC transporter family permease subunit n=1 Tax=Psychromonas sp. KJ10-2 TaxID=3391822 RepID=UPI0039B3B30C